jgi:integrase
VHATLHRALRDAVRWNLLTRSPADAADPPRAAPLQELRVWSVKELQVFLASERASPLYPLWLLLSTTGMRRGEALGLTWEDVDLEAGFLTIRRTRVMTGYAVLPSAPKARRGRRLVALDPATTGALKRWRTAQKEEQLAQGRPWSLGVFLFTEEDGEPYHPERVSKLFRRAAQAAGLPPVRLHDLRHSYATMALGAGIHPKIVSERLGHANIGITLDTYSHCLPSLSAEAALRVAALLVPA